MNDSARLRALDLSMRAQARRILIVGFGALALVTPAAQAAEEGDPVLLLETAAPQFPVERTALRDERPPHGGLSIGVAFARADQDGDGQLSRQEAMRLPVISMRFDELDSDGNDRLNIMEFEAGALTPP